MIYWSEDFAISCFIPSSWCSSSAHVSRCICNVSWSLSVALMCAGSDSLLCFAFALRSLACEYSIQAVQSCDVGMQSNPQSEGCQNCLFGNMSKPPLEWHVELLLLLILWDSLQDKYNDILYLFLDQRLSHCSQTLDYLYGVHDPLVRIIHKLR